MGVAQNGWFMRERWESPINMDDLGFGGTFTYGFDMINWFEGSDWQTKQVHLTGSWRFRKYESLCG